MQTPYYQSQDGKISLYCGEALDLLRDIPAETIGGLISDPPYSSGGLTRSDRSQSTTAKYVQTGTVNPRPSFSGDNRDQRGWEYWSGIWIAMAMPAMRESAYAFIFSDWRMLPSATDVFQAGGLTWRGIIPWNKGRGSRAPNQGYFRHQCEYVVWGTKGRSPIVDEGPYDGFYSCTTKQSDKHHQTGKPTELMQWLVSRTTGTVLDPFAGSGTTLVAAMQSDREAIGIEREEAYCEITAKRLEAIAAEPCPA